MRGKKAKALRLVALGEGYSVKHRVYKWHKKTGMKVDFSNRRLYKLLKKGVLGYERKPEELGTEEKLLEVSADGK